MCALLWVYHGDMDPAVGHLGESSRGLWKRMGNLNLTDIEERIQASRMFEAVRSSGVRAKDVTLEAFDGLWEADDDVETNAYNGDNSKSSIYGGKIEDVEEVEEHPVLSFSKEDAIEKGTADQEELEELATEKDVTRLADFNEAPFSTPMPKAEEGYFLDKLTYEVEQCGAISTQKTKVSIATIATSDRAWIISEYCQRWPGEISLVVYGTGSWGEEDFLIETIEKFEGCEDSMERLTITARSATEEELEKPELFPINELRNLAIKNVKTSHYLYLDIDFWPSTDLHKYVHSREARSSLSQNPKSALVVPAFDRLDHDCKIIKDGQKFKIKTIAQNPSNAAQIEKCINYFKADMPTDKKSLERLIRDDKAHVFDKWTPEAHGTTNANKWLRQRKGSLREVKCIKSARYEPYLVLRRCASLPPFQPHFTGYGKNKIQHILHLTKLSYKLSVLGGGFITHFPHPASSAKVEWDAFKEAGLKRANKKNQAKILAKKGVDVNDFHRLAMDNLLIQFVEFLEDTDVKGGREGGGTGYCPGETLDGTFSAHAGEVNANINRIE
ncbi:hypothetical protein TrVE_jg5958 [Triparma verrucosa]|uniref:Uncharacterized protein n=1 Tax=Triparma verrucosa TaxID=1606542 RepID=A0A9W7ET26_9STRA|nr:hypothetical protein TrVE_jg5958 [Triparma verrucosa]